MNSAPSIIENAKVICASQIDSRHFHTEKCRQTINGIVQGSMAGIAICQYEGENSYYLFGCDEDWDCITDTWHQSLGDAIHQAEFEYKGISKTLIYKDNAAEQGAAANPYPLRS